MKGCREFFLSALSDANKNGPELAPSDLIEVLSGYVDAIKSFGDQSRSSALFEALRNQFGFISRAKIGGQPVSSEELVRWAALLRWLAKELRDWQVAADPDRRKLVAALCVASFCGGDGELWESFPCDLSQNHELTDALQALISGLECSYSLRDSNSVAIWEREAIESFQVADARMDWSTVARILRSFDRALIPNPFQSQIVRCLYRFNFTKLVLALANIRQIIVATLISEALDVEQRLHLAMASDNPYVHFGFIYRTFTTRESDVLTIKEETLLSRILIKISTDHTAWPQWMEVFNRFAIRFPSMQRSLGRALSEAPDLAISEYLKAIDLSTSANGSRGPIAACLQAFRETASPERAMLLWRMAYERWLEWDFNSRANDEHLTKVANSEIDFAVVAYVIECMTEDEREEKLRILRDELSNLENVWHATLSDCLTSWNRILSHFQPYAQATQVMNSGKDWLNEGGHYYPYDPRTDRYLSMMYHTDYGE